MPIVRIEMWEGRSLEQKRQLAREITASVSDIIGCDSGTVRVLITEYSLDDWAVGGTLQADR